MPCKSYGLSQHKLGQCGAVYSAAFLPQDFQNRRIGRGFDRKILLESWVPGKGLVQSAGVFTDTPLIIEVERCGIFRSNAAQCLGIYEWSFHGNLQKYLK